MALAFLNKWGCEVTTFTSSDSKHEEALKLGAHKVVNTRDKEALKKIAASLNFVLSTVNVVLDWQSYIESLAPKRSFRDSGNPARPDPARGKEDVRSIAQWCQQNTGWKPMLHYAVAALLWCTAIAPGVVCQRSLDSPENNVA
jgi:Zinc-binding dehydrogenase